MFGMPAGFADLLRRKYDIMQQQADAQTANAQSNRIGVTAGANLDNVRAGLLPDTTAADIARTQAETANIQETTKFVGPLAKANIGLMGANASESRARGGLYGAQTVGESQLNKLTRIGMPFQFSSDPLKDRYNFIMSQPVGYGM